MYGSAAEKILRIALAFSFLYPAVSAWFNPLAWVGYIPSFILTIVGGSDVLLLSVFGITEILIGLWLIFGRNIFWPSVLAAAYLLGILVFNLNQIDVIFRDISIFAIAVVLALTSREAEYRRDEGQKS
jgi:uncharacterized membrane protein YphA (DoxX/SURF4 family)